MVGDTDGEAAIKALLAAVKLERKDETVCSAAPRYDSQSKGPIENAVGRVEGLMRTMISAVERKYKLTLDPDHAIVLWIVRHCGWTLTRFTVGSDGLTPFLPEASR